MSSPALNLLSTAAAPSVQSTPAPIAEMPNTAPVEALNREHAEVVEYKATWALLKLLYEGGARIRANAGLVLRRKPKEIAELYAARKDAMTYQNVLGAGIDYYLASVFERDPDLDVGQRSLDGTVQPIDLKPPQKAYYDAFRKNCDRRQKSLTDVFRDVLRHVLLYQRSWLLVDLPKPETPPLTLGEQLREGWLDAYVVRYSVFQVINWGETPAGDLDWVVIRTSGLEQPFLGAARIVERWTHFDRQTYRVYERSGEPNKDLPKEAKLVAGPAPHALADLNMVPIVKVEVPKGLWLANRVLPQVLEHVNTENEYSFALRQSNLAVPVISGRFNENPTLSEGGYLKLPEGAQLTWSEPPGASYQRSEVRVASLREEIYRSMYLMAQGRSAADSPAVQSGFAKQLDMRPAAHVQNYLGDTLRVGVEQVLNLITHIRQDELLWNVRGFDFTEDQTDVELQRATAFSGIQVQSATAQRENQKRAVRIRFKDASPTLLDQMCAEIDDNPTPEEQAQQDRAMQQQQMMKDFEQRANTAAGTDAEAANPPTPE